LARFLPLGILCAFAFCASLAFASSASAAPEVLSPVTVSKVSYTSAEVEGEVNPNGLGEYGFEYCVEGADCNDDANWTLVGGFPKFISGTDPVLVKDDLAGLKGGTKYFVRLSVFIFFGGMADQSDPPNPSFTTLAVEPPIVTATDDASEVFSIAAKASGKVKRPGNPDPAFNVTACRFEYVSATDFNATGFANAKKAPCAEVSAESPITAPEEEKAVSAQLAGLKPETTYHLRLAAENASPDSVSKEAAHTFTTPTVAGPTVTAVDDASEVGSNSAKFTGKVQRPVGDDPGLNANCRFEYISDAQLTINEGNGDPGFTDASSVDCEENPITSAGETSVGAKPGLFPNTTYHLRLVAENAGGTDVKVATNTFTTLEAELPVVTIDPVESGTFTTAHVTGTVDVDDPRRDAVGQLLFDYSTDNENWTGLEVPQPRGAGIHAIEHTFTGLQPSTTYFFRIRATYSTGGAGPAEANGEMAFSPEPNPSITTEPPSAPATAEDFGVTNVTANGAHFSAIVDPNAPAGPLSRFAKMAYETKWHFECAPECKNANGNVIGGTIQGEEGAQTVTGDAKRLDANTAYEVSLVVSNEGGGETLIQTFSTPLVKPTIKVASGGSDGKGGYTLQATVNPNGSNVSDCKFEWGPNSANYAFSADCSPPPGDKAKPVTVEAHLTGLSPGVVYHYNLLATNAAGTEQSGDQEFTPTLIEAPNCSNEQIRKENNSLSLPECRAYEMISPAGKEGFDAAFVNYSDNGSVRYASGAGAIANSGQSGTDNSYVATRSAAGWETIPNLNGASGSLFDAPSEFLSGYGTPAVFPFAYSKDLRSTLWAGPRRVGPPRENTYLRGPDGTFTLIGDQQGTPPDGSSTGTIHQFFVAASADLSHLLFTPIFGGSSNDRKTPWGPGVYEYVGTNNSAPRRVDLDNAGNPASACVGHNATDFVIGNAIGHAISADGSTVVFTAIGGCGGVSPPVDEIWARVDGTTSVDVSASKCNRSVGDPDGPCNDPSKPTFVAMASDGSRVFFTTAQQLVDGDTDQTNDLYACEIPANASPVGKVNSCTSLREVSGASAGAEVDSPVYNVGWAFVRSPGIVNVSDDGSTAYFFARGVLAENKDTLGEQAVSGDRNLYVWRQDSSHPNGQTSFVGRLLSNDVQAQATTDGRYLLFATATPMVETDTDAARDVYRYDAGTREMVRISTGDSGVGGNAPGVDADFSAPAEHHPNTAISASGQKVVFTTAEALSPLDGNGEPDVYLWTPGHVSLVTTGSVGGGAFVKGSIGGTRVEQPMISDSGQDIYFQTPGALTPADGDDLGDVYTARVGGGFSFPKVIGCSGESCQPPAAAPPKPKYPETEKLGEGNPTQPKGCPRGKVRKGGKCVKKPKRCKVGKHGKCVKKPEKHSGKKHHGKKAGHSQGGGK